MTKYTELFNCSFLFGKEHFIYDVFEDAETFKISIKSRCLQAECPECGTISRKLHSTYARNVQDTPIHGKQTILHIIAYEYYCLNPSCSRRVFSENIPFLRKYQVRTDALNTFILGIAIFLSNECASRVLEFLGVSISNDSIQRLYDRLEFVDDPDVEAVGIDDVALLKGCNYGTVIYDYKDHHLIALLKGRDAETLKEWLLKHPKINFITRDRAGAYAKAINEVLPDCIQVADRFHLLQNLLVHLKEIFKAELPENIYIQDGVILDYEPKKSQIEKEPDPSILETLHYDNSAPKNPDGSLCEFDNKKRKLNSGQYQRQAQSRKEKQALIRRIQQEWSTSPKKSIKDWAKQYGMSLITMKKYLAMTTEEINQMDKPLNYKKRKTLMDDYLNIIFKMLRDGIPHITIFLYLRAIGCDRRWDTIWEYITRISKNNFPNRVVPSRFRLFVTSYPSGVIKISRNQLLKTVLSSDENPVKEDKTREYFSLIEQKYPIISGIAPIFNTFHSVIMGDSTESLDRFIEFYQGSIIDSFCNSLKKDIAPIKNAISFKASSGFVEGNNNKFKLLKRIVYGRSDIPNLFKKCSLAFLATQEDFSLQDLLVNL